MSKNFELLQQIGGDEELFQTAAQVVEVAPGSALDKETLEKIMEKASSAGLFQTSSEPRQQTLAEDSVLSPGAGAGSASRRASGNAPAPTSRTSRNPATPVGNAATAVEKRVRRSVANATPLPNPFRANAKPKETPGSASEEPLLETKIGIQKEFYHSSPSPWLESIKSAATRWERKEWGRSKHDSADLEAITREEEIKLVQRVFPGTALDSPRIALFASLQDEVGCAPTCARVAELLATRAEGPVCVVDANFRKPSLHEYFGVENSKGLAEATVESGPLQNFAQQLPAPDLWLIPSGAAASELRFPAMADGLRVRMQELRDTFTYVVVHSGPLRMETSAMLLSRWTDGVVLVVEANATRKDTARRVKQMLDAAKVNLLGIVLNNRTFPIPEAIYRRL
jgi:Mrp family chromosome partitioning ATPase